MDISKNSNSEVTSKLENILRYDDPLSLIEAGAPNDEYDCEVPYLIKLLEEVNSAEELENKLHGFISSRFGTNCYWIDYSPLAVRLWSAWTSVDTDKPVE